MPRIPLLPPQASNFAQSFDELFYVLLLLSVFFAGLVFSLILFFALRYRRGSRYNRKMGHRGQLALEITWSVIPLVIGLTIFFYAARPYAMLYGNAPSDAMEVFVIGKQWMWHFQHPDGVRENNELHLPAGKAVKLTLISQDVIHSFYVPAFRVHRDVVPGRFTTVWFVPRIPGQYHLLCSQYCGTEHSRMTGTVTVMEPAAYQAWLASGGQREQVARRSMVQAGEALFDRFACVSCHGFAPARAPSLVDLYGRAEMLESGQTVLADHNYLRTSILEPDKQVVKGYQPIMPSFKGQFTEEEVLELIAFIKSLHTGDGVAGPPTDATMPSVPASEPPRPTRAGTRP